MDKKRVIEKFGKEYWVDDETFVMGIHHLLGDHIAQRFRDCEPVLDSCCGAGFMAISLSKYVNRVIAVEVNPKNLDEAKNNAKIANVSDKIQFVFGDILSGETLGKISEIGAAFLDPDWAKADELKTTHASKLSDMQPPANKLFDEINKLTRNIALRLPREIDLSELKNLPACEIEKIYLGGDFKFYCAYFGNLANKMGETEFRGLS